MSKPIEFLHGQYKNKYHKAKDFLLVRSDVRINIRVQQKNVCCYQSSTGIRSSVILLLFLGHFVATTRMLLLCHNVKNVEEAMEWSYRRKIQQDTLGKVNRIKENRRREKDGLKITDNSILWGRHEYKKWGEGRVCEVKLGHRRGSSYGEDGRGMRSLRSSNFSNPRTSRGLDSTWAVSW